MQVLIIIVWIKLGLPVERCDEDKQHRISKGITNNTHTTKPPAKMADHPTLYKHQGTRITANETLENRGNTHTHRS
jgi:hypothetical protein